MITSTTKVSPSERIRPYKWHMTQASLRSKVNPITEYSSHRFYQKEQAWLKATAASLSERYEAMRRMNQPAAEAQIPSAFSKRTANPYQAYELSSLYTQQASHTGLFFNQIF